jgi:TetR/AcrR family transcriptional repressor of nem operon
MVRSRTFDPAAALRATVDLFASKGYSETSMEDVVATTGVSRYGLYGTFGNKRELFEQALELYAEQIGKSAFQRLAEPGARLEHIRRVFEIRIDDMCSDAEPRGCLFIHTAMELAPQDEELKGVLRKFMTRMSKLFAIGLRSAINEGDVNPEIDVRGTAEMLTSLSFGLSVLMRSGFPRETLDRIVDSALAPLAT